MMDSKSSALTWYVNERLRLSLCVIDLFHLYLLFRELEFLGKPSHLLQVPQALQGSITVENYREGVVKALASNVMKMMCISKQIYFRAKFPAEQHPGRLWAGIGDNRGQYWHAIMYSAVERARYSCYNHLIFFYLQGETLNCIKLFLVQAIFFCSITALALRFSKMVEAASLVHLAAAIIAFRVTTDLANIAITFRPRLPDGTAKSNIDEVARRVGYNSSCIYLDPTVEAAEITDLFGFTAIKINEQLLDQISPADIVGIIAHELGHWKYGHSYCGLAIRLTRDLCVLAACKWAYGNQFIYDIFNFSPDDPPPPVIGAMVCWTYICPYISDVIFGCGNVINSFCEAAADRFANNLGLGRQLRTCLIKMVCDRKAGTALSDPWYHAWFIGYPSLLQRIESLPQ